MLAIWLIWTVKIILLIYKYDLSLLGNPVQLAYASHLYSFISENKHLCI